jgi:hypothetical protein
MSEYQYYEFLAIERQLTEDETAELRKLSTRATITPVSFTNEYNWGDFKGDPEKLMQRHFDALPRTEINSILKQLLEGKVQQAERSVKNRFAALRPGIKTDNTDMPLRTVGQLRQNAEKTRQNRLEKHK